jgi:hypothetical protein
MLETWKKLTSEKAAEIIDQEESDAEVLELLQPDMRPEAFMQRLSEAGKWTDAAMFMARCLPKREAVWWACVCAAGTQLLKKHEDEAVAHKVAEKWAFKPNDENRKTAFLQAQKSNTPSIGTMACLAAAFSDGKLELSEEQILEPDPAAFPKIISGIVLIAANDQGSDGFNTMLEQFIQQGIDIACGGSGKPKDP